VKLSSIERNPDTKQLEVVFSFNDNLTVSVPVTDERATVKMIKSLAESFERDADFFISKYKVIHEELKMYSKFRTDLLRKKRICSACNIDIFFRLVCGETLSMSEIYWFDWFCKKHGLIGRDYE